MPVRQLARRDNKPDPEASGPVHPAVTQGGMENFLLERLAQLLPGHTPSPVFTHAGGLIHPAAVIQAQVILHGNDAGLGLAHHC